VLLKGLTLSNRFASKHFANIDMIVDGNSENNNLQMDQFIQNKRIIIKKLVALRDSQFSNSLIDAHFSLFKYNDLYKMKIGLPLELIKAMEFIELDFIILFVHMHR
jgi:hypothetical protein